MSVDHKRPLLAFAVVTVACIVILANAVRSEAFVSVLRSEASHVVSGLGLAPADHRPGHRLDGTPQAAVVDAPEVTAPARRAAPAALHGVPPRGHRESAHVVRDDHAHGHAQHAGGHRGDPDARLAHAQTRGHGHHRGHGDHQGDRGDQGDRGPATAQARAHPPARQHR